MEGRRPVSNWLPTMVLWMLPMKLGSSKLECSWLILKVSTVFFLFLKDSFLESCLQSFLKDSTVLEEKKTVS